MGSPTPSPGPAQKCNGTKVCCDPTKKDLPQLCPNQTACPDCGTDSCKCFPGPSPGPTPSPPSPTPSPTPSPGPAQKCNGTKVCCDPTKKDPPQLCPNQTACPDCGTNSCKCPSLSESETIAAVPPACKPNTTPPQMHGNGIMVWSSGLKYNGQF